MKGDPNVGAVRKDGRASRGALILNGVMQRDGEMTGKVVREEVLREVEVEMKAEKEVENEAANEEDVIGGALIQKMI